MPKNTRDLQIVQIVQPVILDPRFHCRMKIDKGLSGFYLTVSRTDVHRWLSGPMDRSKSPGSQTHSN